MTKSIFLFSLLFAINFLSNAQDCNCKYIITPSETNVDAISKNIQPGDTVCIQASTKKMLRLVNFHGDSTKNIVVINYGGQVKIESNDQNYGMKLAKSSYVHVTGTGSKDFKYGIKISCSKVGKNGFSLDEGTTNYEVDHLDIANSGFAGIFAKTDPKCDLSTNRGNFTQYQTIIHDNYIHNSGGEGMYIGHSYYSGCPPISCDGVSTVLMPSVLKGVRVYNNIVDSTRSGGGIQVGSAVEDCEIYGNTVTNAGIDLQYAQNNGIQMGGGTTGKCYNNYIANSSGNGIIVMGLGNSDIYNNVIVNAGYKYFPADSTKRVHGIYCNDIKSTIPGNSFNFYNNTIINPKNDGIRFSSTLSKNNKFYNNIILKPGSLLSYSKYSKETPYINIGSIPGVDAVISNNYFYKDLSNINFIDLANNNYRLSSTSPAIDAGMDLLTYGISYDFDNNLRPSGSNFDLGAYEFQYSNMSQVKGFSKSTKSEISDTGAELNSLAGVISFSANPNPSNGRFTMTLNNKQGANYSICILNSLGQKVYSADTKSEMTDIDVSKTCLKGLYFLNVSDGRGVVVGEKKIVIR